MHIPFLGKKKPSQIEKDKTVYYPVCPSCLSPQIKPVKEFTSGWLTPTKYYCPFCNYSGQLILEIDVKLFETKTPKEIRQMFLEEEFERIDDSEEDHNKEEDF